MNHQDELPLAKVSEIDEAKRQWLQGMRHPVDTVTEPEPAEILAEFIRQHSAAGQLVARAVFLSPPYSAAVIALAFARTRFATLTLSLKWQINVISALRPDWQKAFRPFASVPARNTH